jgi:hypothetical protein
MFNEILTLKVRNVFFESPDIPADDPYAAPYICLALIDKNKDHQLLMLLLLNTLGAEGFSLYL